MDEIHTVAIGQAAITHKDPTLMSFGPPGQRLTARHVGPDCQGYCSGPV